MYVINEARLMCCGMPRGKCTCGGQATRNYQPTPLGLPRPMFEEQVSNSQVVVNQCHQEGVLGQPEWSFNPVEEEIETVAIVHNDGTPTPLGQPVWNW